MSVSGQTPTQRPDIFLPQVYHYEFDCHQKPKPYISLLTVYKSDSDYDWELYSGLKPPFLKCVSVEFPPNWRDFFPPQSHARSLLPLTFLFSFSSFPRFARAQLDPTYCQLSLTSFPSFLTFPGFPMHPACPSNFLPFPLFSPQGSIFTFRVNSLCT